LAEAIYADSNEWILNGRFHDQIDWPPEQILQGITQVLMRRDPRLMARKISNEQVYVRVTRIEVRTARSGTEHIQPANVEASADLGNVIPAHLD
jgi:hypothetical protein